MTIKDFVYINWFLGNGYEGHKWNPTNILPQVHKRVYCRLAEMYDNGKISIDYTSPGRWAWKKSLQDYKALGNKVIFAVLGGFYDVPQPGNIDKRMPINPADNPYSAQSWERTAEICYYIAALFGNNPTAYIDPNKLQTRQTGSNYRLPTEPIAGQRLVDIIEIRQEALGWKKGWNGVTQVDDIKSFTLSFYECLKAIWDADPDMDVCVGAHVHNRPDELELVNQEFKRLSGHTLQEYQGIHRINFGYGQIYLQFHNYLKKGDNVHADSPENHNLRLNEWDAFGLPYIVGEFGSDTVAGNTTQLTPLIAGLNIEQSMAELNNRQILWYTTGKNCQGVAPYEGRNEEDNGGLTYRTCGYVKDNSTYAPKDGLSIFETFLDKAKDLILPSVHSLENGYHVFRFQNGTARYKPSGLIEFVDSEPSEKVAKIQIIPNPQIIVE